MALDSRFGSKESKLVDKMSSSSGPFIGIIKNNVDANRSGRLQVFIPDLGGIEDNPSHWRTVQYASPFFGTTNYAYNGQKPPTQNEWKKVKHTYGMWFTPPDIDNQVLVTFVMGNPSRGFWFACVNTTASHNMTPGMAGSAAIDRTNLDPELADALKGEQYPTAEFNETNWEKRHDLDSIKKPIHEEQVRILLEQGLEDDLARGVITSSSMRESPSAVFGISTPGRDSGDEADLDPTTKSPRYRIGGHQFIMDDGNLKGEDQMIRLRTAAGHQIMMNDSEDIFYIATANGKVWMEFTGEGKVHMYAEDTFSLRAKKEINLHSDTDINMHAGNNINMFATNAMKIQSNQVDIIGKNKFTAYGGELNVGSGSTLKMSSASTTTLHATAISVLSSGDLTLSAAKTGSFLGSSGLLLTGEKVDVMGSLSINSGEKAPMAEAEDVTKPEEITVTEFPDAIKTGLKWSDEGTVNSTVTVVPHHEPWLTEHVTINYPAESGPSPLDLTTPVPTVPNVVNDTFDAPMLAGPAAAIGAGLTGQATDEAMSLQPAPVARLDRFTITQTKALLAQLGNDTNSTYTSVRPDGRVGKYLFTADTLISQGLVDASATNDSLSDNRVWTGKYGISSRDNFLSAPAVQESIIEAYLLALLNDLYSRGLINDTTDDASAGGFLIVAYNLGIDMTMSWANTGSVHGSQLYNQGRYAITVLTQIQTGRNFG